MRGSGDGKWNICRRTGDINMSVVSLRVLNFI